MTEVKNIEDDSLQGTSSEVETDTTPTTDRQQNENISFSFAHIIKENHGKVIYDIAVNTQVQSDGVLFATVGANSIHVYRYDTNGKIHLIHGYLDPDPEEMFYTCAWTLINDSSTSNQPKVLLAAAGFRGVIRIIDITNQWNPNSLKNAGEVYHLVFSKTKPNLLVTASKNCTVCLWDVLASINLVIFHGSNGHTDQVICADINDEGTMIASSGMDLTINLWSLTKDEIVKQIQIAEDNRNSSKKRLIKTSRIAFPDAQATSAHENFIDCIKWYDDLIISRAADDTFCIWQCLNQPKPQVLFRWELSEPEPYWFIKFGISFADQFLAFGSFNGKITVWDLKKLGNPIKPVTKVSHPELKTYVRKISFSHDGKLLMACSQDKIFIYKKTVQNNHIDRS